MTKLTKNKSGITTPHDLQVNGLKIFQHDGQFKFGSDAVRLANFVKRVKGTALDIGSGTGIIPILLAGKLGFDKVVGVEINSEIADISKQSIELNNLQDKVTIINDKVQNIAKYVQSGSCAVVTCNPPYNKLNKGDQSANDSIAQARFEKTLTLKEVAQSASFLLSTGGKFYIIHQIDRMAEVIHECSLHKLQPKVIKLLDAKIFVCQCTKDGKVGLKIAT